MGILQYKKGTGFEQEFAELLDGYGYYTVLLPKKADGSQPFDLIAEKNNKVYNFDCKTLSRLLFPLSRIEENQERAFLKAESRGNHNNYFAIKTKEGAIHICDASTLIAFKQAGDKSISPSQIGVVLEDWISNL